MTAQNIIKYLQEISTREEELENKRKELQKNLQNAKQNKQNSEKILIAARKDAEDIIKEALDIAHSEIKKSKKKSKRLLKDFGEVESLLLAKSKLKIQIKKMKEAISDMRITEDVISKNIQSLEKKLKDYNNDTKKLGVIILNVGGTLFTTLRTTITKKTTFLSALISGKFGTLKDKDGNIFIDRDPKYFEEVLHYMRTGELKSKYNILDEFEYYGYTKDEMQPIFNSGEDNDSDEDEEYYDYDDNH